MLKAYFFCLLMVLGLAQSIAANVPMEEIEIIKQAMVKAVESARVTDSLYTKLIRKKSNDALITAYIGTLEALKAKHAWNPYNKVKYVSLSQKTMAKAVKQEPNNLQIRFMRFSIQHFTPGFLGYSTEIQEDRKAIISHYKNKQFGDADKHQVQNIANFMIESGRCTGDEIQVFEKYI